MNSRFRLQKIIDDARQFIIDVQSWNDNRPDEEPMDCEPERVVLQLAETAARHWDNGKTEQAESAVIKLVLYAEQAKGTDDE